MSINVNVSGNPVRISRGKMVTASDPSKIEFEKRRLMRLEQVRQQSKDIAETVRNRFKKEKTKCLSEIEKDGEVKLKNWQARKLLELQNQYQEALEDIGLGHKSAAVVESEEENFLEQQESNDQVAKERGRAALERMQIERNEENLKKAVPIQRKKITRDMENARASVVASSSKDGKNPFKKIKKGKTYDSDSENRIPHLVGLGDESDSSSSGEVSRTRINKKQSVKTSKGQQTSEISEVPTSDKAAQTIFHENPVDTTHPRFTFDNRISERIKRRSQLRPEVDYCDFIEPTQTTICTCCYCRATGQHGKHIEPERRSSESKDGPQKASNSLKHNKKESLQRGSLQPIFENKDDTPSSSLKDDDKKESNKKLSIVTIGPDTLVPDKVQKSTENISMPVTSDNKKSSWMTVPHLAVQGDKKTDPKLKSSVPSKPKVTLKSKDRPAYVGTDSTQPVQHYDHKNRYSKSVVPVTSHVEKIDDDELVVSPVLSDAEIREKMRQRDVEAHLRGQLALEKEKLQREYRELMKKLPLLQKQERIYDIGMDKEKYHMTRDRLEELEKKRQNRLDNAYEELFVRKQPALVTLPKRKDLEDAESLNVVASWDADPEDTNGKSRCDTLNGLLSNLKSQKDSLLKEIESTLTKESKGFDDVKSASTDYTRVKSKRKRSRDERPQSPTSSDNADGAIHKSKPSKKGTTISTTTSPSPRKKAKLKTTRKVLQNTSTQTTPQPHLESVGTSPIFNTPATTDLECPCKKDSDVCEIVIKLKEDDKPEVQVKPPYLGTSVKVVSEGKESSDEKEKIPSKTGAEKKRHSFKNTDESKGSPESEKNTWKNHLSQSGSSQSTSTTYFDPPSTGRSKKTVKKQKSAEIEAISRSMSSSNGTSNGGQLDPRLLTYIKKLLNMSRSSIDDLTVSAASDVSTPSHSVMETPSNNPLSQLMNVMKYFNLDVADLRKQLNYTSDESSKHFNTSESVTVTSSTSDGGKVTTQIHTEHSSSDPTTKLLEYADIAASCTKKISDLTAMIEKVRAEKKKMLDSSGSDKELTTTSYKDLPDKSRDSDKSSGVDKLLEIDYGYAEKLKQMTKEEIQKEKEQAETDQLLNRLQNLIQARKTATETGKDKRVVFSSEKKLVKDTGGDPVGITAKAHMVEESIGGKSVGVVSEQTTVTVNPKAISADKPIFLNIPKLPPLQPSSSIPPPQSLETKKKRPPPSKGLRAIGSTAAPHELSTIIEADSQVSTKIESPSKVKSSSGSSKSGGVPHQDETSTTSDDVSELDTMETMLISIGMEWAIPTLKKTREALAMASTSSNGSNKESGELSLKEFLSKISSTSSTSSGGQGISLIEVDNRKTSTPIAEVEGKKGPIFTTDEDLSSVKAHSKGEDQFYDLANSGKEQSHPSEEQFYDLLEGSSSKTR